MVDIFRNRRLATEEEKEMFFASFIKAMFDSMTEQEKKDIANKMIEGLERSDIYGTL